MTAAHAAEPRCYGALENYVDLGRFCSRAALRDKHGEITALSRAYKEHYRRAYALIHGACAALETAPLPNSQSALELARDFARSTLPPKGGRGRLWRRFFTAFTHRGFIDWSHEGEYFQLETDKGVDGSVFLLTLSGLAQEAGYEAVLGMDPLMPRRAAVLLLPHIGLALRAQSREAGLDGAERDIVTAALAAAQSQLQEAKGLHDELEAVYAPAMDFDALTQYTHSHIEELTALL